MNTLITLVRREFWEHRYLWIWPFVIAGFLILVSAIGSGYSGGAGVHIEINGEEHRFLDALTPEKRVALFGVLIGGLLVPQIIGMLLTVSVYVIDCLYAERKDRSILFWKSLPVSDAQTVGAKFLTAVGAVPLLVYAVSVVTSLICYVLLTMRFASTAFAGAASWDTLTWVSTQGILLLDMLIAALWYAPLVAALMAASAWVRRNPYLWITLAPLVVMFVERRTFGTNRFAQFLEYRLTGFFSALGPAVTRHAMPGVASLGEGLNATRLLASPDLWLGAVAAAGLLWLATRLRRYNDDT